MSTKSLRCPICGCEFNAQLSVDYIRRGRAGLDGNTHEKELFDRVYMCPSCGYSSASQSETEDEEIADLVESGEFQAVFKSEWDEGFKKWMLAGYISKAAQNHYDSAYEFMVAGWYIRMFGGSVDDFVYAYNLAISEFATYIEETYELEAALIMLDLLRQIGNFEKATDIAFGLKYSDVNEDAQKIIDFELECISKLDISEHFLDEV